jgi:hypothetical protein
MPSYKVEPEKNYPETVASSPSKKSEKRYPTVSIPVSPEIIAAFEVGEDAEITLTGKVRGLESRSSADSDPYMNRNELRLELRVVDAEPADAAGDDEEPAEDKKSTMKGAIDAELGYGDDASGDNKSE